MDEKIIIKAEPCNVKVATLKIIGGGAILGFLAFFLNMQDPYYQTSDISYILTSVLLYSLSYSFLPFLVIAFIFYKLASKVSLTVSDKRVYGTAAFGKRVDLPVDMISSVGTSMFNGIAVASSSGTIKFVMIKNKDEVHSAISRLLLERQERQRR